MKFPIKDTAVFYKQKDETHEIFFVRIFNLLIMNNQLIEDARIHIDFNDNTKNSNWIAVDYTNLSNE